MSLQTLQNQMIMPIVSHLQPPCNLNPVNLNQEYVYTDVKGNSLFIKQRYTKGDGSKGYAFSHEGDGKRINSMPKFTSGTPLYNLYQLAKYPDKTVYLVEGEKCVDALTKLHLLATTSGGAASDDKANWESLVGHKVIQWPDNDEPGKAYMQRAKQKLLALNVDVKRIDINTLDLTVKGDVCDWLEAFEKTHGRVATADDIKSIALESMIPVAPFNDYSFYTKSDRTSIEEWLDPEPLLQTYKPYDYPLEALPNGIKAAVREVLSFVQCPPALAACSALSALSLSAQHLADVRRAESLTGPISLYFLTVAESGERKTACDNYFTQAIRAYESEQTEIAKSDVKNYVAAMTIWQAKIDGLTAKIKGMAKGGKSTQATEQELQDITHDEPAKPRVPRLLYGDTTSEQLAYSLAHNYPTAAIISSEAGVVFGSHSMSGDGTMRNLALLNVLWDGGIHTIDRRISDSYQVKDVRLTMGLAVQYDTVKTFFERSKNLARGTGFAARFLIAQPTSTQGYRPFKEAPASFPMLAAYNKRITDLLNNMLLINDNGGINPPLLDLSPTAKTEWIAIYNMIELELRQGGDCVDIKDVASKAADNVARLAALFHVYEYGASGLISREHVACAGAIIDYHLLEAKHFLNSISEPVGVKNTVKLDAYLVRYCRQYDTTTVPKSYVMQHSALRDKNSLNDALEQLAGLNRIRAVSDDRTTLIELNPKLLVTNT